MTSPQAVLPHIEEVEAEHAFLHIIDDVSGHLLEAEEAEMADSTGQSIEDERLVSSCLRSQTVQLHFAATYMECGQRMRQPT